MKMATKALLVSANKPEPMRRYEDHEGIENRKGKQPRDDRGRYLPKNEMRMNDPEWNDEKMPQEESEYRYPIIPSREEIVRYDNSPRQMNRIGFNTGDEMRTDYATNLVYPRMNEMEHHKSDMHAGHGKSSGEYKLTREDADEWMHALENEDGSHGAHWTFEQVRQVMGQKNVSADPLTFYVVLNMIYSDYGKVFRKYGMADKLDFYVDMAKAFIEDKDAVPDKAAAYYEHIVRR